jgi:hypothetical protein
VDNKQKERNIIFYKDYFQKFFVKQKDKVKDKIIWTFELIEELQQVPETYLKHVEDTDGLYEIRIHFGNDIFRIFCFFDKSKFSCCNKRFTKEKPKNTEKRN